MDQATIEKVMKEVAAEMNKGDSCCHSCGSITDIGMTEFVGTAIGHPAALDEGQKYRKIGNLLTKLKTDGRIHLGSGKKWMPGPEN